MNSDEMEKYISHILKLLMEAMRSLVIVLEYKPQFNIKLEGIYTEGELIFINFYSGDD